ncbi:denticleless [Mytilus galloprovincialis]|uniref:Denticleless n=1 Tax=Mytilus galloprovincialis TaxID=29158 RepID=A0A8B6HLD6_MYTGA|nr:denticleless [Mytilus galloprovincialis]
MLLKHLETSRKLGIKCYSPHLFSQLLEQYESSVYDEYGIEGEEEGSSVPPLACEFSKEKSSSHILGLVDENGYVVIYNTNKYGQEAIVKDWRAHSNAIFDLAWMGGDSKLLSAAGDQTVVLWDVPTAKKLNSFQGHTSSVRSVNFKTNDPAVFATGSRDGHVMIWDIRCNKKGLYTSPVQVIKNAHSVPHILKAKKKSKLGPSRDSQQSVTIVVYQTDMTLLSAGAVDGCVKMWDLRKNYSSSIPDPMAKHTFNYSGVNKRSHGYSSLVLDSSCTQLFASCTDDIVYQYNLLSLDPKPVAHFKGHQNKSFYVKAAISPDDQFLLSGSSNEMAYIWKIDKPNESPVVLKGHNAEVTDVSWNCNDFTKLATLSDDNTMRIWRLNRRLEPRLPREVTGYSERTHREIGISASQHVEITPNKIPCTPKTVSPSILHFLSKSAQKATCDKIDKLDNKSNVTESTKSIDNSCDNIISQSTSKSVLVKCNEESMTRVSCKRKLVCDDEEDDNPRKRHNIGDQDFVLSSPNKPSTSSTNVMRSPWKCDDNPQKWLQTSKMASPIGSPRKRCAILLEKSTTDNSPSKLSLAATPKSVPSHVKTKLFNSSPTVNLPNLVEEGTVRDINVNFKKCDKENSPKKSKIDWLTKKRLEKETESPNLRKDFGSPRLRKTKSISQDTSAFKKDSYSPKINKKNKLKEDKTLSSPCRVKGNNSQEEDDDTAEKLRETPPKGMKSLKHYFSVK